MVHYRAEGQSLHSTTFSTLHRFLFNYLSRSFSCGVLEATGRVECWGGGALGDVPSLDVLESKLLDEVICIPPLPLSRGNKLP